MEEVEESPSSSVLPGWMDVTTTWHDTRDSSPRDGDLVLGAVAGRSRTEPGETPSPEQDFWFVLPMHFRHLHPVEDSDRVLHDRYLDADRVVRRPFGADGDEDEVVTHWAEMPTLPGIGALELTGAAVSSALATAQEHRSAGAWTPGSPRVGADRCEADDRSAESPSPGRSGTGDRGARG